MGAWWDGAPDRRPSPRTITTSRPQAREGCDRCYCGCKYWENDQCIDCGTTIQECLRDPAWVVENRDSTRR